MDTSFFVVRGAKIAVPTEVCMVCRKMNRRLRYLKHKDAAHGLVYFSSLDTCDYLGVDNIADPTVNVEETVIAKVMGERVKDCLMLLSEEERTLIWLLYFEGISEVALARTMGIPRSTLKSRKYVILRKLRNLLENP